jgi:hypothetical protein
MGDRLVILLFPKTDYDVEDEEQEENSAALLCSIKSILRTGVDPLNAYFGVVIRHATGRVGNAPLDKDISFRPVDLQVAPGDRGEKNTRLKPANLIHQQHAVILPHLKLSRVLMAHQHRIARRAIEWVDRGVHQRIKLRSTPGGDGKSPFSVERAI